LLTQPCLVSSEAFASNIYDIDIASPNKSANIQYPLQIVVESDKPSVFSFLRLLGRSLRLPLFKIISEA
jgi:hypothetical protein